MRKRRVIKKMDFNFKLPVILVKRDKNIVEAQIPTLDIVTQGYGVKDALKMAKEAAIIFFEDAIERGVLEDLLLSLGWNISKVGKPKPPPVIGSNRSINVKIPEAA